MISVMARPPHQHLARTGFDGEFVAFAANHLLVLRLFREDQPALGRAIELGVEWFMGLSGRRPVTRHAAADNRPLTEMQPRL